MTMRRGAGRRLAPSRMPLVWRSPDLISQAILSTSEKASDEARHRPDAEIISASDAVHPNLAG